MPNDVRIDQEWKALAELDGDTRVERMTERFRALISASEEHCLERLGAMVHAEYELDDAALREFTHSRLQTWAELAADDPEGARLLGRGYDAIFAKASGEMAMRRASMVQSVGSNRLTPEDLELLFDVIPSLEKQLPRRPHSVVSDGVPADAKPVPQARPFWSRLSFRRSSTATG